VTSAILFDMTAHAWIEPGLRLVFSVRESRNTKIPATFFRSFRQDVNQITLCGQSRAKVVTFTFILNDGGSIMPVILDFLYREYCRARLAEMRKQLFIPARRHQAFEANCDADHPESAADQADGASDSQYKADHDRPN
jgi:hypothetical protein